MKLFLKLAVVLVGFLAALPFIVLSAMGLMRPAEGFCIENGFVRSDDPPTAEELAQSYFASPELSDHSMRVTSFLTWPICIRSRRGQHRFWATNHSRELARLDEPNLRQASQTSTIQVYRVLTAPSFSRIPIALRLDMRDASGAGILHVAWLEDDGQEFVETNDPEAYDAWQYAPLPTQTLQRNIVAAQAEALGVLFSEPPSQSTAGMIDGNWLVIESIRDGRRDVRTVLLSPPPAASGRLFCALAEQSQVPAQVLADGHVDVCSSAPS